MVGGLLSEPGHPAHPQRAPAAPDEWPARACLSGRYAGVLSSTVELGTRGVAARAAGLYPVPARGARLSGVARTPGHDAACRATPHGRSMGLRRTGRVRPLSAEAE